MKTTSSILNHLRSLRRKRKATAAIVTALSMLVAAGVFWQLRLTGISMTADPQCGYEVHAHGDGCSQVSVLSCTAQPHAHTDACRNETGELICGAMDLLLHTHDSRCTGADGALVCTLAEIAPHQHGDACYTPTQIVVDPGHQHGESCYSYLRSTMTACGQEESPGHAHTDACITGIIYGCGLEESDDHMHSADCGIQNSCGIPASQGHAHTEECYPLVQDQLICTEEVREPVTEEGEPELTCTQPVLQLHDHTDACRTDGSLTCGMMELKSHQHTDDCFRLETREGQCQIPAHEHTDDCYPDLKADVEKPEDWEADLPELQEDRWADNLIAVARSQLGYAQSQRNFMAGQPGQPNHYTRYGQWAENPYGDWRGQYISFCLHYAGIPEEAIPYGDSVADWAAAVEEYLVCPLKTAPQPGDVLFLDNDGDHVADAVGILAQALPKEDASAEAETAEAQPEDADLVTLQGNVAGQVAEVEYDSAKVLPFLRLSDARVRYEKWLAEHPEATEPTQTTESTASTDATEECIECQQKAAEADAATAPTETTDPAAPVIYTKIHEGSDYTITATYGEAAGLGEDAQLKVEELLPGSKAYEEYYAQVKLVLGADNLLHTRLFDVTFLVDGKEVEPDSNVNVSIRYHEPVVTSAEKDTTAQVVHFAESGTEVLPAQIQKDDRGITEISHTQDSFSVVAFAMVSENPDDGPEGLPIDWYVFLDMKWTRVGSTRSGWKTVTGETSGETKTVYHIEEKQALSILGAYGFTGGEANDNQLLYRKVSKVNGIGTVEDGIWNSIGKKDADDLVTYAFESGGAASSFRIYFAPGAVGDDSNAFGTEDDLYTRYKEKICVYSVRVKDDEKQDYPVDEVCPVRYAVHNEKLTMTVRKTTDLNDSWALFSTRMDFLGDLNTELGTLTDVKDSDYQTLTIEHVTQPIIIARQSKGTAENVETSIPPDSLKVTYYVYLNGSWKSVGETHSAWSITGRLNAQGMGQGIGPYQDPHKTKEDTSDRHYSDKGMYYRDVIRLSDVEEILGPYGFVAPESYGNASNPEVDPNLSVEKKEKYRFSTLGYQAIGATGMPEHNAIYFDTYCTSYGDNKLLPLGQADQLRINRYPQSPQGGYWVFFVPGGTTIAEMTTNYGMFDPYLPPKSSVTQKTINFHVHVDDAWTNVGSTQYVVAGSGTAPDKLSIAQIQQVLSPYGFAADGTTDDGTSLKQLFYKNKSGTFSYGGYSADQNWYQLALPGDAPDSYDLYWLPGNTAEYSASTQIEITKDNIQGTFHLLSISDPSRTIYESLDLIPRLYVRYGEKGEIKVKIPPDTKRNNWILSGRDRNVVLAEPPKEAEDKTWTQIIDGVTYTRTENDNGTYTFTISPMNQTVIVAFPFANGDRSLSNLYADGENATALDVVVNDPNIKFTMHNYSTYINELLASRGLVSYSDSTGTNGESHTVWTQSDAEVTASSFAFSGAGGIGASANASVDADDFRTGHSTVRRNLEEGYPTLLSGGSLDFLFNGKVTATDSRGIPYIKSYTAVNTPLQIIDDQYRYYSYFNAVDFNTEEQKFYLRPYVERAEATVVDHRQYDDYGDFLPFNHSGGELISDRSYNFYQEDVDYWYGMTMDTRFYVTGDGTVSSGADMIFGFNGGDDTYVYIDDVLILDMGGTHGAVTGTINFRTGLVQTYYNFDGKNALPAAQNGPDSDPERRYHATTLYKAFEDALLEINPDLNQNLLESELARHFDPVMDGAGNQLQVQNKDGTPVLDENGVPLLVYRFKAYSTHALKLFYMDRNSDTSMFNLYFNLPTISKSELTISLDTKYGDGNEVTVDDQQFYTDAETHQFRIVRKDGSLYIPLTGSLKKEYQVMSRGDTYVSNITADSNGIFRLKSDQYVILQDIMSWMKQDKVDKCYVQELIPQGGVNSTMPVMSKGEYLQREQVTIGEASYYAYSIPVERSSAQSTFAPFTNIRDLTYTGKLRVGVDLVDGTTCTQKFPMKVFINGQLVPEMTKFVRVGNNKNYPEYVRADAKGEIYIQPGSVYEMAASLISAHGDIAGYTYSVEAERAPEGWALAYYTHNWEPWDGIKKTISIAEDAAASPAAAALSYEIPKDAILTGPITGTITTGNMDIVRAVNKKTPISLGIKINLRFEGLEITDNLQRTAVYEITQMKSTCDTGNGCGGDFVEWTDPPIPADLAAFSDKQITAIGAKPPGDEPVNLQLAYTEEDALKNGDYFFYKVTQKDIINFPEGEAFITDKSVYIVKVLVADQGEKLTAGVSAVYDEEGVLIRGWDCDSNVGGKVELDFVNTRINYRLPNSGGVGTATYIFSGTGCVGLTLLMYRFDPHRKKNRTPSPRSQRRRPHRPER